MADLKSIVADLPTNAEKGRITKGAALATLGRFALYNQKWSDAIDAYNQIYARAEPIMEMKLIE